MNRKLIPYGKGLAATLPAEIVRAFQLKKGSAVDMKVDARTGAITINPGIVYFEDGKVTERFKKLAEEIMKRRAAAFRKLAE